ncbi:MAG: AbrB/MazE/SpoVT family DNA-binding domain-containing protein [Candidatus Njordarchaeia archaeon]
MVKEEIVIKELDDQGRLVLPARWRKRNKAKKIKLIIRDTEIIIKPVRTVKLSQLFDTIEVDVKSPLTNWKKLKKEMLLGEST